MNGLGNSAKIVFFLLLLPAAINVWAGPPFQTDDPEPLDAGHFEAYAFGGVDGTPVETDPLGPAFELNYGATDNLFLHLIVPFGAIEPSNNPRYFPAGTGPSAFGLTDTEIGIKYRFFKQHGKYFPEIGTFDMIEVPTGSYARGLGVGKVWYKLPLWVQKNWGPWTTYGGAGYAVVPQTDYRNYPFGGWLLLRDFGKKWTLGGEVFSHGAEGLATPQTRAATMIDLGGYYYIRNPGWQILFAYGHTAVGQRENYAYLGLYHTWGPEKKKDTAGFLHHDAATF